MELQVWEQDCETGMKFAPFTQSKWLWSARDWDANGGFEIEMLAGKSWPPLRSGCLCWADPGLSCVYALRLDVWAQLHPSRIWTTSCTRLEAWSALVGAARSAGRVVPGGGGTLVHQRVTLFLTGNHYSGGDGESVLRLSTPGLACVMYVLQGVQNGMTERLDKQAERLDQSERRVLEVEDGQTQLATSQRGTLFNPESRGFGGQVPEEQLTYSWSRRVYCDRQYGRLIRTFAGTVAGAHYLL
ncbi:hypothetical protein NDU88_000290 [Pleurodeles waltl]|uniref:Uncharacterized protein n=1 Tax=Pleurodeles waltl TaxID=8319 RepID=A0AAV7TGA0_PLEWA|nr:hypothetical protein NDU88_000290 [Pleurodeles waltl]